MEIETPPPKWRLRECGPGDAEALALVGSATMLETYAGVLDGADILLHCEHQHSPAKYAEWLGSPGAACCVIEAEPGGAPVGYAVLSEPDLPVTLEPGDLELKRIYMLHRFQGAGAGGALLRWGMDRAHAMGARRLLLGVYGQNHAAQSFYARHGLRQVGTRQFTVGTTVHDDLVLGIRLPGGLFNGRSGEANG